MKKHELSKEHRAFIEEFIHWLGLLGYGIRSLQNKKTYIQQLFVFIEEQGLSLDKQAIQSYIIYVQQRLDFKRGINRLSTSSLVQIYHMLRLLEEFCLLLKNQFLDLSIPRIKKVNKVRKPLRRTQINLLYEAIDCQKDRATVLRDRAMLALFYGCGLRQKEVECLQLKHLIFRQQLLYVAPGKTGRGRYIPLTRSIIEDLKNFIYHGRYIARPDARPYLIISIRGNVLSQSGYGHCFIRWRKIAPIKQHFSAHILRHTIATHLLQAGMPLQQIADFLGHKSLASTQIYTHIV